MSRDAKEIGRAQSHWSNNLDLMRLLLAAAVVLSHTYELIDGNRSREPLTRVFHTISLGEFVVDAFFIVSGFVIAMSWDRQPSVRRFMTNRILRIYPGFAVAYLFSVIVVGAVGAVSASAYLAALSPVQVVRQIATLARPAHPPTFSDSHYPVVNGAMWTIHYEFLCYVGIAVAGALGLMKNRWPILAAWLLSIAVFVAFRSRHATVAGAVMGHGAEYIRFGMLYLSGVVAFKFEVQARRSRMALAVACLALAAGLRSAVLAEATIATAGAYLLFWVGFAQVKHDAFRGIPDVSYGLYLYGWPMEKLVIASGLCRGAMSVFAVSLVGAILMGYLSYVLVERPALKMKRARPRVVPVPAVSVAEP